MAHRITFDIDSLEHSPLEQQVTRDDVTLRIDIFRPKPGARWTLEIFDRERYSVFEWDHEFESDEAALREALETIEKDGIESVRVPIIDSATASWSDIVGKSSNADLRELLDGPNRPLSFQAACGVLATAVAGPYALLDKRFELLAVKRLCKKAGLDWGYYTSAVTTLFGDICYSLGQRGGHCCPAPSDRKAMREFCAGYVKGAELDPVWATDEQARKALAPIRVLAGLSPIPSELNLVSPEERGAWLQRAREQLPQTIIWLTEYWRAQNRDQETCKCGSGKSYKKCCAN